MLKIPYDNDKVTNSPSLDEDLAPAKERELYQYYEFSPTQDPSPRDTNLGKKNSGKDKYNDVSLLEERINVEKHEQEKLFTYINIL